MGRTIAPVCASLNPPTPKTWLAALREWLIADFVEADDHVLRGYFAARANPIESKRWQSKGGESVSHPSMPKRPYYDTYWGYLAALKISPEYVEKWRPITLDAVRRHFGGSRWLRVVRDYSFAKGPTARPMVAETIRHTVRAADQLYLLHSEDRLVSATAWNLVSEASDLQRPDGGWVEFRSTNEGSFLWSSIYVFRFLSILMRSSVRAVPDERAAFLGRASSLVQQTEHFLIGHWKEHRWTFSPEMPWQEGAAAVLHEVAEFLTERNVVYNCYDALRSLVSPCGCLLPIGISHAPGAPPEAVQALGLAYALQAAGDGLSEADSRYHRLVQWVSEHLKLEDIPTYEIVSAIAVLDLNSPMPA